MKAQELFERVNTAMANGKTYEEAWELANAGTSEGARKGWEHRPYPHRPEGENELGFMERMAGRNPYEMTKKDWDRFQGYEYLAGGERRARQEKAGLGLQSARDLVHKAWVKHAIETGKEVHPDVLKDYPDIAK